MPPSEGGGKSTTGIDRRAYLATVGATGVAGLAGCGGGDGGDGGDGQDGGGGTDGDGGGTATTTMGDGSDGGDEVELGEPVPTLKLDYPTGLGGQSSALASMSKIAKSNVEEALGVSVEVTPKDIGTMVFEAFRDERTYHYNISTAPIGPRYMFPDLAFQAMDPGPTIGYYSNCEFTELWEQIQHAPNEEELRSRIQEANRVFANDMGEITLLQQISLAAYKPDSVEFGDLGRNNFSVISQQPFIEGASGDVSVNTANSDTVTGKNHLVKDNLSAVVLWNHYLYSPLVRFNKNWELEPYLAESYELRNDSKTFRFNLRSDARFQNGDQITAGDLKWTFEHMNKNSGRGTYFRVQPWQYESIEAVDETTLDVSFAQPNPRWLRAHASVWGALPSDFWIDLGIEDNPKMQIEEQSIVSGGPFKIGSYSSGSVIQLEPNEEHWNAPDHTLTYELYSSGQSAQRAFQNGDINVFDDPSPSAANQLRGSEGVEMAIGEVPGSVGIAPSHHFGPSKFNTLNLAISQCLNRQLMNQVVYFGLASPILKGGFLSPVNNYYPEDDSDIMTIAPSPTGSAEVARQTLSDAGWGWDDDGNLHYPADADLSPLFPQGESRYKFTDQWPCLEELYPGAVENAQSSGDGGDGGGGGG